MELLDPRVDFVFKRIFGSENNKDVLLAFLNRIFTRAGEPPAHRDHPYEPIYRQGRPTRQAIYL